MAPNSHYTPDGDIAYLRLARHEGRVNSRREPWGVGDYDESGALVAVEVWSALERLPKELVAALPRWRVAARRSSVADLSPWQG